MSIHQLEHNETNLYSKKLPLVLLCDGIRTPENIGMIFRVSEAFGVNSILFTEGCPTIENVKVRKTSRDTFKNIDAIWSNNLIDEITKLKDNKYQIIGLELTNISIPIQEFNFNKYEKLALIIGSERNGIRQELINQTDNCVQIPMCGKNSSMNVVNALSIALYEIGKQKKEE